MIPSVFRENTAYNVLTKFIQNIPVYLKNRLQGFVEQTFLCKTYHLIYLHNTTVLRYTTRFFILLTRWRCLSTLFSISTITSSFINGIQKLFFTKRISEKSSTKLLWKKMFLNTLRCFLIDFWWNYLLETSCLKVVVLGPIDCIACHKIMEII